MYMVPDTGHQKAAEAIMKVASTIDPQSKCVGLDAASHAYPFLSHFFNRMYLQMLKRAPKIWDFLYDNPDIETLTRDARGLLTLFGSFRTQKILRQYQPKAVVCTQAVPATAMAAEKKKGRLKVPLVCVITDFGVHRYWCHPEVDMYLVAHEDIKEQLIHRGIDSDRVCVTGIPIHPHFGETMDPKKIRRKFRLRAKKKTVLIMGGSRGIGYLEEIVDSLQNKNLDGQILVICGHNRRLFNRLNHKNATKNIRIMGYVKNTAALMTVADVLITKPGGLTSSEALAKHLPMILTNPIPGQEERNVQFLIRHGAATLARTPEQLIRTLTSLLEHPRKYAQMQKNIQPLSRPHSAWESARRILDMVPPQ
ncbi:hypothetical protein BVX98_02120 [bacterium F11]|nr:hypothetical protein BVX98_02120 [bacterium F11]